VLRWPVRQRLAVGSPGSCVHCSGGRRRAVGPARPPTSVSLSPLAWVGLARPATWLLIVADVAVLAQRNPRVYTTMCRLRQRRCLNISNSICLIAAAGRLRRWGVHRTGRRLGGAATFDRAHDPVLAVACEPARLARAAPGTGRSVAGRARPAQLWGAPLAARSLDSLAWDLTRILPRRSAGWSRRWNTAAWACILN
jgi:hypothetical protein